jgi:hypothetical protein
MRTTARPRHYLHTPALLLVRPLFRYSTSRDAYVLRLAGNRGGPVLKSDRRRTKRTFEGPDRRDRRTRGAERALSNAQKTDIL